MTRRRTVLVWHVHGSWLTALVQGPHRYLVPVLPDRGPDGLGRARTWDWPADVVERTPEQLRDSQIDVVVLQRPGEAELVRRWTGLRVGLDVPAVYLEHNTPSSPTDQRHPAAALPGVPIVHVTAFNALVWDNGSAPVRVVEHGVLDPGPIWTGELNRTAMVSNDPLSRPRVVGADLLHRFLDAGTGLDVFGMGVQGIAVALGLDPARVGEHEDLPQHRMHAELARRGVYLHLTRWTSLGLSLVEAMTMGMPVAVLATTAAPGAVPPAAGVVSDDPQVVVESVRELLKDRARAAQAGAAARQAALARFGLARFLRDWDEVFEEVTG